MPNLLLVTSSSVALLRGSIFGAVGGFFGGLLVDTANLETLGADVAAAHRRRLLDRPLRRDDRPRPHATRRSSRSPSSRSCTRSACSLLHFLLGDPVVGAADPRRLARPGDRVQPDPDRARVLARAEACSRRSTGASVRGRCACLASAERPRAGTFLPPTRGVEEPYRLTPQMALRVAMLGGARARSSSPRCSCGSGRCRCSPGRSTCASRRTTSCGRSGSTRRAGRSSTATAACSSTTAAAPPSQLWPADLPKQVVPGSAS